MYQSTIQDLLNIFDYLMKKERCFPTGYPGGETVYTTVFLQEIKIELSTKNNQIKKVEVSLENENYNIVVCKMNGQWETHDETKIKWNHTGIWCEIVEKKMEEILKEKEQEEKEALAYFNKRLRIPSIVEN